MTTIVRVLLWSLGTLLIAATIILGLAMYAIYDETAKLPPGAEIVGGGIYSR